MTTEMKMETRSLASLRPAEYNPRVQLQPADPEYQNIKRSIETFGYVDPIIINQDGTIIGGHQRYNVMKDLGYTEAQVVVVDLDKNNEKALNIALNKITGEWDEIKLKDLLLDLDLNDYDLTATGFSSKEVEDLVIRLDKDVEAEDDDFDADADYESIEEPVTQRGDIWILGDHRLMCGDSTDLGDVNTLMGGEEADLVITDPPYNVNYANSAKDKMRGKDRAILNDNLGDGFYDFLLAAMTPTVAHCQGGIYVAMSSSELDRLQAAFRAAGGHWSTFVIWAKNTFTLGRADYQRQYEPILYGWPEGADRHWCGDRDQGDVWQIKKPQKNDLHPTMKPVELLERAIRNSSRPGDVVLDPFGGSGTTMIAAHKSGRKARLIELDPKYVDVIVRRWQNYAGAQAIRQSDGVVFDTLSVGGELRQEIAAGDVGHVADVAELAGGVGENHATD